MRARPLKSTPGGFSRNPQEERRNPPMKPRQDPAKNADSQEQGEPDGSDRIHAAKGRARGGWQQGGLENDPPISAGHFSMRPDDPPTSARHLAAPNIVPAVWQGLRLAPIQETEAPKRPANFGGSHFHAPGRPTGIGAALGSAEHCPRHLAWPSARPHPRNRGSETTRQLRRVPFQAPGSPTNIRAALCSAEHCPRHLAGPSARPRRRKPRLRNDPPHVAGHFGRPGKLCVPCVLCRQHPGAAVTGREENVVRRARSCRRHGGIPRSPDRPPSGRWGRVID